MLLRYIIRCTREDVCPPDTICNWFAAGSEEEESVKTYHIHIHEYTWQKLDNPNVLWPKGSMVGKF